MKKIILISILTFSFSFSFAQGNLQFNRVINFSARSDGGIANTTNAFILENIKIPAGKVWKIEHVMVGNAQGTSLGFVGACVACAASFNDIIAYVYQTAGYSSDNAKFPIWLSEGNYSFIVSDNDRSSSNYRLVASYSAIEFNIIP